MGDSQKNASRAGAEGQCAAIESGRPRLSLGIVPVKVRGCDGGREIEIYAFLDNDSDTTLYLYSFAQRFSAPQKPIQFFVTSINAENSSRSGFEVAFNVKALKGKDEVHLDKVWTVDRLPISKRDIPAEEDIDRWPHPRGIEFPRLDGDGKAVGILIGKMTFLRRFGSLKRDVEGGSRMYGAAFTESFSSTKQEPPCSRHP